MKIIASFFAAMLVLSGILFTAARPEVLKDEQAMILLFLFGSQGRGAQITSYVAPPEVEVAGLKKWLAWAVIL